MQLTPIIDIVCAVFIGILSVRSFSQRSILKSSRRLHFCLILMAVVLLVDAGAYIITGPSYPLALRYMLNLLAFTATCINGIAFLYYLEALFAEKGKINPWYFRVIKIIEYVWLVCSIYEYIAGNLVSYSTNGIENVNMTYPSYIVIMSFAIVIVLAVLIFLNRRIIGKKLALLLMGVCIIPLFNAVLYSFIGIDLAYALSGVMLVFVAEFIQKNQVLEQLSENEKREMLAENASRFLALEDSFEVLYDVDLTTGKYDIFVKGQVFGDVNRNLINSNSFFEDVEKNLDVVYPDDRQGNYDITRPSFIRRILEERDHFDRYYRLLVDGKPAWARMRIIYKDTEKKNVIIGVFNADEEMEAKQKDAEMLHQKEQELAHSEFRASALAYLTENEGNVTAFLDFFAGRLRDLAGCDQVFYRDEKGNRYIKNAPELGDAYEIAAETCANCPHSDMHSPLYASGVTEMEDTAIGVDGVPVNRNCPVKSALTRTVNLDGETVGYLAIHYILEYHEFTDYERRTLEEFSNLLSILLSRYYAKKKNAQLERELELRQQLQKQFALSDGLAREYHTVWLMDGTGRHNLHLYRSTGKTTVQSALQLGLDEPCFDTSVVKYIRDNVLEEDQERVIEETKFETIERETPETGTYAVTYRRYTSDRTGYTYHQMCFAKAVAEDGAVNYILAYRDADKMMREQIAQQKRLAEALNMADAANKAKTDFLFNMSHDIRTPMNAIIGFTNMAKKDIKNNPQKALDNLEKVQLSSDILLNLINDVLDMSRIESGKAELHEEKQDVNEVFDTIEPAMGYLAASKEIDLQFRIGDVRDRFVFADGPRFDRVLINIISNAIKYTPAGGFVNVSAEQTEDTEPGYANYRFSVADSGIGMSEEFQKHMFEDFTREENSTTSGIQGTGLGLSLAKKLVDLMKGSISCISKQGIGTTFTIDFPFRLQSEAEIEEGRKVETERRKIDLKGRKALLVEDNEMNREIASEILTDEGILVETAVDGQKAVNKVRERGSAYYDFILMDIQMPVMDGYEATKTIHNLMPDLKTPIIALSANAFMEDKQKSLEAGMDDHVAKPINVQELMSALEKLL